MPSFCDGLAKQNPQAHSLCLQREAAGDSLEKLDQGDFRLNFKNPDRPQFLLQEYQDAKISAQEIYQRYLDLAFGEERNQTAAYLTHPVQAARLSFPIRQQLAKAGLKTPFLFGDQKLFALCLEKTRAIIAELAKKNLKQGSAAYKTALARALFDLITQPAEKGGLGIKFYKGSPRASRDLAGIVAAKEATCLEFAMLFLALARLSGLHALPIEIFRNSKGYLVEHVRIGVPTDPEDPKKMLFCDISDGLVGEREGEQWAPLPWLDLWAYYYNAAYVGANPQNKEESLQQALRLSPFQYMLLSNYGHWSLRNQKPLEVALKFFLEAKETNPQYPYIFKGLAQIYREQQKISEAEAALETVERLGRPSLQK